MPPKIKASFEWNQIPLFFSQDTRTLFTTTAPGVLRIDSGIQNGLQSKTLTLDSAANQAQPFDLRLKRNVADFKLTYSATYKDLTGPAAAAHFHGPADAKTNAGVVVPVPAPATGGLVSPLKGEATLTDAQAADLAAGKWYFNVHTAANKGGEIRGQVMKGGM